MAGLRERKKQATRTSIQREALRLFSEKGFEATTVEQIADAAGISPATFYRYFTSKEDSVVSDDYDPLIVQSMMERPADESLVDTMRAVISDVLVPRIVQDRDLVIARHNLRRETPALAAAVFEEHERSLEMFAGLIARHVRRSPDDIDVRIACGALSGAIHEAFASWLSRGGLDGEQGLRGILNYAIDRLAAALDFEEKSR